MERTATDCPVCNTRRPGVLRRQWSRIGSLFLVLDLVFVGTVVLPRFQSTGVTARRCPEVTQIRSFENAIQIYTYDNGRPPTTEQGLRALYQRPTIPPLSRPWTGPYMDGDGPPRDQWGHEYVYLSPGPSGEAFYIGSYGADGRPGGECDDADIANLPYEEIPQ